MTKDCSFISISLYSSCSKTISISSNEFLYSVLSSVLITETEKYTESEIRVLPSARRSLEVVPISRQSFSTSSIFAIFKLCATVSADSRRILNVGTSFQAGSPNSENPVNGILKSFQPVLPLLFFVSFTIIIVSLGAKEKVK